MSAEPTINQGHSSDLQNNSRLEENTLWSYFGVQITLDYVVSFNRSTLAIGSSLTHSGLPTGHWKPGLTKNVRVNFILKLAPALKPHF